MGTRRNPGPRGAPIAPVVRVQPPADDEDEDSQETPRTNEDSEEEECNDGSQQSVSNQGHGVMLDPQSVQQLDADRRASRSRKGGSRLKAILNGRIIEAARKRIGPDGRTRRDDELYRQSIQEMKEQDETQQQKVTLDCIKQQICAILETTAMGREFRYCGAPSKAQDVIKFWEFFAKRYNHELKVVEGHWKDIQRELNAKLRTKRGGDVKRMNRNINGEWRVLALIESLVGPGLTLIVQTFWIVRRLGLSN